MAMVQTKLVNCSLEIGHVGTEWEIAVQKLNQQVNVFCDILNNL